MPHARRGACRVGPEGGAGWAGVASRARARACRYPKGAGLIHGLAVGCFAVATHFAQHVLLHKAQVAPMRSQFDGVSQTVLRRTQTPARRSAQARPRTRALISIACTREQLAYTHPCIAFAEINRNAQ
eukprot:2506919-Pleurochrysis_carterae.AAC.2